MMIVVEARVFFPIATLLHGSNAVDAATISMTNSNTVHSLVSLTPCLFGLPPSNTTTTINSPCTPPTISNVVEKVVGSFRSSFVEEREDLYLVLPPPAGCFVGIKWRSTVPAVQDVASREMRLDALLSQNVEIKVCPSSSSSSLHGTHISSDPGDVQGWAKFNVLLRERANHQHVQWQQECSPNVSPEIRFALTVQSCLEEIAKQCQDPELSNSLHSAAKAVFSEQSETNSKEATNSRTTNNAMRWPSFRFMTVSKSRVQAPVLGGYGAWMEETDLVVRDATFHFVSIGDDTNNFCSGQSSKQNEERKARSWCVEGIADKNVLKSFVSKTCKTMVPGCFVGSYPHFLAQLCFPRTIE